MSTQSDELFRKAALLLRAAKEEIYNDHAQPCECMPCRLWHAINEWEVAYRTQR